MQAFSLYCNVKSKRCYEEEHSDSHRSTLLNLNQGEMLILTFVIRQN